MKVTFKHHNDESWSDDNFYWFRVEFAVKDKIYKLESVEDVFGLDYNPFIKSVKSAIKRFRKKIKAVGGRVKEYDKQIEKIIRQQVRKEVFEAEDFGYELIETTVLRRKK